MVGTLSGGRLRRRSVTLAGFGAIAMLCDAPASALGFIFNYDSSVTTDEMNAIQTAGAAWSQYLADPITVTVNIGFAGLSGNTLASTSLTLLSGSPSTIANALIRDAKSADDQTAIASFSNGSNVKSAISVTSAQARAIGFSTNVASDGTITFSNAYVYSTSRAVDGSIAAGTYDLVGIAEHELGHVLGFASGVDISSTTQTALDLFRFTPNSTSRTDSSGAPAAFSIDGGQTDLAAFSNGVSDQGSHWANGTNAVMAPEASAGRTENISPLDLRAMDVIGYDVVSSVPEPASWALMITGFGAVGIAMRRQRKATARIA